MTLFRFCPQGHMISNGMRDSECPYCLSHPVQKATKKRRKRAKGTKTPKQAGKQRVAAKSHDFDSDTEHRRYQELALLEKAGVIQNLETQPKFELTARVVIPSNAIRKGYTQAAEIYTADFRYTSGGMVFVEDVKGLTKAKKSKKPKPRFRTPAEPLKVKHLMRIWRNDKLHTTHQFFYTVETKKNGDWLYFNSNKTQLDFELIAYSEAA